MQPQPHGHPHTPSPAARAREQFQQQVARNRAIRERGMKIDWWQRQNRKRVQPMVRRATPTVRLPKNGRPLLPVKRGLGESELSGRFGKHRKIVPIKMRRLGKK